MGELSNNCISMSTLNFFLAFSDHKVQPLNLCCSQWNKCVSEFSWKHCVNIKGHQNK